MLMSGHLINIVWIVISLFMLLAYLDCYYEVEKIVAHKTSAGDTYQVKWKDGGSLQWIAACDLDCGDLIIDLKVKSYLTGVIVIQTLIMSPLVARVQPTSGCGL